MANNNNEGAENNPDNSKDSGLDKSFVGKFVSGLFNSTPLSKWLNKDASKSKRREDDEDCDRSSVCQPPSKRPRPSDHNNYSAMFESPVTVHHASNNVNNVKVYGQFPEPGPSGVPARKLFERHNTGSTNTVSSEAQQDVVNGDNDSDSEESTSGYSSAPKLVLKGDSEKRSDKEGGKVAKNRSLFTTTSDSPGRSLFSDRSPQTSLSSRRPAFNSSTFGSANFVDRTLSTKRIMNSPFYSGTTIYGGASAYSRRLGKTEENRVSVQIKPVNSKPPTENATLSKTARRILSTLEQYSTPITDAKKIPVTPRRQGLLSNYVGATPYLVRDRKKPINQELQVPTVPDLLQMKQKERLQNSTESVRQMATKSKSTLNQEEYKLRTEEEGKLKHSNKMKSSVASVRQKVPIEPVKEVKLPKVSLPITTLPKFDFVLMPPSSTTKSSETNETKSTVSSVLKPTVVVEKTEKIENGKTTNSFTFSEPVVISKDLKPVPAINCFKFSEPVPKKIDSKSEIKTKNNGDNTNFAKPLDVFKNQNKNKWECPTCLVRNDESKAKCVACDEPKPGQKEPKAGFGDQFKMSSDKWECSSCLVRNNLTDNKCVACSAAKPGSTSDKNESSKPSSQFGDKFKPSSDTWECSVCLIRNKDESDKCIACETAKPGAKPKPSTSNLGTEQKFTFGIKQEWECQTCLIKNKNELIKCAACETPKDSTSSKSTGFGDAFKIKGGEWECSSCLVKNKANADVCVCCGVSKPGTSSEKLAEICKSEEKKPVISFNFGIDKSSTQFKFGIPSSTGNETNTTASTISVGDTTESSTTNSTFKFGISTQESKTSSTSETVVTNPLLKPNEKLPEKGTIASVGFKFGLDSKVNEVATSSTDSTSAQFGVKPAPMFQFKPTVAVNGDIKKDGTKPSSIFGDSKPKDVFGTDSTKKQESSSFNKTQTSNLSFGVGTPVSTPFGSTKPTESPFGGSTNKPIETPFGASPNKPVESPFGGSTTNKLPAEVSFCTTSSSTIKPSISTEISFGTTAKAATDTPFGSTSSKPVTNSPFGSTLIKPATDSPFGSSSTKPATDSPFGSSTATKPITDSPFGKPAVESPFSTNPEPKESPLFGTTEPNKQPSGLFGNVSTSTKPQEVKEVPFGNKPIDSTTMFAPPTTTPTFTFAPKPTESPTSGPVFKFGSDPNRFVAKRAFGETSDGNVSNGFGSAAKVPAFGQGQTFGESKPFSFGPGETQKNSFNFAQNANKPNPTPAPVFSFGGGASGGFNFSAPSGGFNFGAKAESPPFGQQGQGGGFGGSGAAKNGSFNFGTNANNNNQKAVFSFGANQTGQGQQQGFAPGQGQQGQGGFNFGAPAPVGPTPGGFNFSGAPPTFNFTDGGNAAQPQRKIKKALRRTHR